MKNSRKFWTVDVIILVLSITVVILSVLLGISSRRYLFVAVASVSILIVFLVFSISKVRHVLRRVLGGGKATTIAKHNGVLSFAVPLVVLSGKNIAWFNNAFETTIAEGKDPGILPINRLVPGIELSKAITTGGQEIRHNGKSYTIYGNHVDGRDPLVFLFFIENTELKAQAAEYRESRPSVLYFLVDTYDEILKELRESERATIMSSIDLALERYVEKAHGFIRRVSSARYIAVVEERYIKQMVDARFDILDAVRINDEDAPPVTLSIGVGRKGDTFKLCEEMAAQALDMALGRGGDQAAIKSPDGFEFYGGVSRSVEKRTKVKSRIIAAAIKEIVQQSERVLIMGHKNSDMDSLGAATGMLRFSKICKKPAAIVINKETTLAGHLLAHLEKNGYQDDLISPEKGLLLAGEKTLLIVVDTHMGYLLESPEIYKNCGQVIVIDHHRRMVGYIDDAVIFHHEPYASSASELVSELLQYSGASKEERPTPTEAEALLAGIMLDTRVFSLHVGVRTFEAAAYLRRLGAETEEVKKMFASSKDAYLYRSHLVAEAKVYMDCAIVVSNKIPDDYEVVAPQAANDLLTIEGIKASFVAIQQGDEVRISARSMGEINVQIIMENLGGGGHLTMAGTQMKGISLEEVQKKITDAITEFYEQRAKQVENK